MNAHFPPPAVSRERTSREQADLVLIWHDGFAYDAERNDLSGPDHARRASAWLMASRRCAEEACVTDDPDVQLMLLSVAGRYAQAARLSRTRARELGRR